MQHTIHKFLHADRYLMDVNNEKLHNKTNHLQVQYLTGMTSTPRLDLTMPCPDLMKIAPNNLA